MTDEAYRLQPEGQDRDRADLLEGWKSIADYLKKTERTVQRWEKNRSLPVRRLEADAADEQPRVFAYRSEIDAWWQKQTRLDLDDPRAPETVSAAELDLANPGAHSGGHVPRGFFQRYGRSLVLMVVGVILPVTALRMTWPRIERRLWPSPKLTLAILPIQEYSDDPEAKRIANELTDELVSRLARLRPSRLAVVELAPSEAKLPASQMGRQSNADYVLKGEIHSAGGQVAIDAQLVAVKEGQVIWGFSEKSGRSDVISFEILVADAIAGEVFSVLPKDLEPPVRVSQEAYEAYLTGRALWSRRTTGSLKEAIGYFEKAIQLDPKYAPAYAGLADCYALLGSAPQTAIAPREAFPKAEAAARQALALDESLSDAHVSLGYAELVYDWNYAAAQRDLKRAIDLRPNSATAHQYYAYYLTAMGKPEDAIRERVRARELQPDSPLMNTALGEAYYQARQFDKTIEQIQKSLVLDPGYGVALINLARTYDQMGRHAEALQIYEKIHAALPNEPVIRALIAYNYAVSGKRERAQQALNRLQQESRSRYIPSVYIALIYIGLGEKQEAFQWLEKAYDERCEYLVYLPTEPMADPLRQDARFSALLTRLGLAPIKSASQTRSP